jgi:hypothetical protein
MSTNFSTLVEVKTSDNGNEMKEIGIDDEFIKQISSPKTRSKLYQQLLLIKKNKSSGVYTKGISGKIYTKG